MHDFTLQEGVEILDFYLEGLPKSEKQCIQGIPSGMKKESRPSKPKKRNRYYCSPCLESGKLHQPFSSSYYSDHIVNHCLFAKNKAISPTDRKQLAKDDQNLQKLNPIVLARDYPYLVNSGNGKVHDDDSQNNDTKEPLTNPKLTRYVSVSLEESPKIAKASSEKTAAESKKVAILIPKFAEFLNSRTSGKSRNAQSTKETTIRKARAVLNMSSAVFVHELFSKEIIESTSEKIDSIDIQDGSKLPYATAMIEFLKFCKDEFPEFHFAKECDWAISKWMRIVDDFMKGRSKERSEKIKKDVDALDNGKLVELVDCFHVINDLKKEVEGLDFSTFPDDRGLKILYSYIVLHMCLKSIIRPSVFSNITVNEFNEAKLVKFKSLSRYVIRVKGNFFRVIQLCHFFLFQM